MTLHAPIRQGTLPAFPTAFLTGQAIKRCVRAVGALAGMVALTACAELVPPVVTDTPAADAPATAAPSPEETSFFLSVVPPDLVARAAPYQDLTLVRLEPETNCYWYQHTGPVETTLLPVRTSTGRPLCVARAAPAT